MMSASAAVGQVLLKENHCCYLYLVENVAIYYRIISCFHHSPSLLLLSVALN